MRTPIPLLLLSVTSALAITPDESRTMADAYISYQRQDWAKCVAAFEPLLQNNPALATEMAKPTVSNDKAGDVLKACKASLAAQAPTPAPATTTRPASSTPTATATPQEVQVMADAYVAAQQQDWTRCVTLLTPLLQKNPALTGTMAKPTVSNDKAGDLLTTCKDAAAQSAVTDSPAYRALSQELKDTRQAAARALAEPDGLGGPNAHERYRNLTRCLDVIARVKKQFPGLMAYEFDRGYSTRDLERDCQAALPAAKQADAKATQDDIGGLQGQLSDLNDGYKKAMKAFQDSSKVAEKTDSDLLRKDQLLAIAVQGLENTVTELRSIRAQNPTLPLTVGGAGIDSVIQKAAQALSQARAGSARLAGKVGAIRARYEVQMKAALLKLTTGDRQSVYRQRGYPSSFQGGQGYDKLPEFSADPMPLARYVASATQWYYAENSQGCDYRYFFNKDKLVRIEKPLGC